MAEGTDNIQKHTPQVISDNPAQYFHKFLPKGQYSGITHIKDDTYAVVSDEGDGFTFYLWQMKLDSETGRIISIENLGVRGDGGQRCYDLEGIAYNPHRNTMLVSSERTHSITEMDMSGKLTGRSITLPENIRAGITANRSLEALCYDIQSRTIWTALESTIRTDGEVSTATNGKSSICRFFAYDDDMKLKKSFRYQTEAPEQKRKAKYYALGISAIEALGDGRLLVLERESRVNPEIIGSKTRTRIYIIAPDTVNDGEIVEKQLLLSFDSHFNILHRDWANYEGIAITPMQPDGSRILILVADSQRQHKGILKDWIKTIKIKL